MTAASPRRIDPFGAPSPPPAQTHHRLGRARQLSHRRSRRGLLLAATAAFALLLAVVAPAMASATTTPPVPSSVPSAGTTGDTGPTPDPRPGASPVPPGQETPATPAPTGGDATPVPGSADSQPGDGGAGEPCPAGNPDCATTPQEPSPPVPQTTPPAPDTGGGGGGVAGWIADAINDAVTAFFRGLVTAALNPLLDLLGHTLLTTPEPSQIPAIGEMWSTSWAISAVAYSALIMFGGITVMSLGTVQSRISIKEIAPRVPLGFLASGLSQFLATKAIQLVNPLPGAILGPGLNPDTAAGQLRNIILGSLQPATGGPARSIFVVFLGLFLAGTVAALLCTYIARIVVEVCLIGAGPIALAGHGHPVTERMAFWWWRAFFGCLGIQVAQSFVLIGAFRVFFTPGGFTLFGVPTADGVVNLLAAITLMYFLFRIPFWMLPRLGHHGGGGGIVGRIVRAYVIGRVLGALGGRFGRGAGRAGGQAGRGRGGRGQGGRGRPAGRPGGGPGGAPGDPYDRVEADANGQLLIPLTRVPRVRRPGPARGVPRPPRQPNPAGRGRPRHRQLTIPFGQAVAPGGRYLPRDGGAWVERGGQMVLPFDVDRRPAAPPPTPTGLDLVAAARQVRRQMEAPDVDRRRTGVPGQSAQPRRLVQQTLPLEGLHRTPRPARPAAPRPAAARPAPPASPAPPPHRQPMLPNMPRRPRPPAPEGDQPR